MDVSIPAESAPSVRSPPNTERESPTALNDLTERVDAEPVTDPGDNPLPKTFICR